MRRQLLLGLIVAACTWPAFAMKNEPNGFRGLNWESDLSAVASEMRPDPKNEGFYTRANDKMEIGGAELDTLSYRFTDNKFRTVYIRTKGVANQSAIIAAFKEQFGDPWQPNKYIDTYYWDGNVAQIIISCNSISEDCTVILSSAEMEEQEKQRKEQQAKDAKQDF